jgi:hypothetical protein
MMVISQRAQFSVSELLFTTVGKSTLRDKGIMKMLKLRLLQPCRSQLTLYPRNTPNAVCAASPEDKQVILETRRGS